MAQRTTGTGHPRGDEARSAPPRQHLLSLTRNRFVAVQPEAQRLESAEQPVDHRQLGRAAARAAQDDQLPFEQEVFCDDLARRRGHTASRL